MTSEHTLQNRIRNAIADLCHVWRVNVGTGWTGDAKRLPNGTVLIANPRPLSSGLPVGFADLVGWRTVTITQDMVGTEIAQFCALEIKTETGKATTEQKAFLAAVRKAGGLSAIVRSVEDAIGLFHQIPNLETAMTPEEFCRLHDELGLTSAELADVLGVSARTVTNYRCGLVTIPGPVAALMPRLVAERQQTETETADAANG